MIADAAPRSAIRPSSPAQEMWCPPSPAAARRSAALRRGPRLRLAGGRGALSGCAPRCVGVRRPHARRATARAVKLGSRKCSMALPPPSAAGMPTKPATIAPTASTMQRHRHRLRRLVRSVPPAVPPCRRLRRRGRRPLRRGWRARGSRRARAAVLPRGPAVVPEERHRHQAEHVERRHQRRHDRHAPDDLVVEERLVEDLVLAEEPRERRDARDRQRPDQHRHEGDRQVLLQAAHVPHVLLAGHRVDDRAGAEEEQGLEERVRHQVERAGRERAHAHRQEHVAELRHRRVRQHALDVVLHQADRRRHERRRHADDGHDLHRHRRVARRAPRCGPPCTRPPSPSSPRGSGPTPASGLPSRPAARRTAGSAPTCPWRRRTAAA